MDQLENTNSGNTWAVVQPWLGRCALAIYLTVLVLYIARNGLPTDRVDQTIWILIGIFAAKLGRTWRVHVRAVVDWIPLLAALLLYDYTRGIADTLGMPIRVSELVDAERFLFGGEVPTVWLQERFFTAGEPQWWDVGAAAVYMSHFIVPWALAAAFYMISRSLWWRYIRAVLILSYAGLLTYIVLPAAPPWYAGGQGIIPEGVARTISYGWSVIGLDFAGAWLSREQAAVNEVAALPSLHAAFALLVSVALWPIAQHYLLRIPITIFPVAMGLTLVYSGEHYVFDILLGWLYVGVIMLGLRAWDRWWQQLDQAPSPSAEAANLPQQVAGAGQVGRPDEQPAPAGSLGNGAPDAGVEQDVLDRAQLIRGHPLGDGVEQPVLRTALDPGPPLPERPPRNQN